MRLVAGCDSSTQSTKVVVCEAETGRVVRFGQAFHPPGTEIDPRFWWEALEAALDQAGGLEGVEAVSVAGQQHGMVLVDGEGATVRPALLWNDTRSAAAAEDLIQDLGGPEAWVEQVGSVPVASFTVTKLRWVRDNEQKAAKRAVAVALPHDWLTWKLRGEHEPEHITTDRSDASGTGYFDSVTNRFRPELVRLALGKDLVLPRVVDYQAPAGHTSSGVIVAAGMGDNAAAAHGVGLQPGDVLVSLGTSGVACALATESPRDSSGLVAGFAGAVGGFLPLVCTLNGAKVLDRYAELFDLSVEDFETLALSAESGSGGVVTIPFFEGERTPNLPHASAQLVGLTLKNLTQANLVRSSIEGLLCGLAEAIDYLTHHGVIPHRVVMIGGAARNAAVRDVASRVFEYPVLFPDPAEYVALGAARQAAELALGHPVDWTLRAESSPISKPDRDLRVRYGRAREAMA